MRDLRVSFPKPCDEPWEKMTPAGCDRICARCDKVIHDLSQLDFDAAEALMRADPDTCVRARIGADGAVALKPGRSLRRMVVAVTVSLLAASTPAIAQKHERRDGVLTGRVSTTSWRVDVTITGPDGKTRRQRLKPGGRYRFTRLLPGTYTLAFTANCSDPWTVENVVIGHEEVEQPVIQEPGGCIIVGKLLIEDDGTGPA